MGLQIDARWTVRGVFPAQLTTFACRISDREVRVQVTRSRNTRWRSPRRQKPDRADQLQQADLGTRHQNYCRHRCVSLRTVASPGAMADYRSAITMARATGLLKSARVICITGRRSSNDLEQAEQHSTMKYSALRCCWVPFTAACRTAGHRAACSGSLQASATVRSSAGANRSCRSVVHREVTSARMLEVGGISLPRVSLATSSRASWSRTVSGWVTLRDAASP